MLTQYFLTLQNISKSRKTHLMFKHFRSIIYIILIFLPLQLIGGSVDSVGIEKSDNGNFILHKVESGEGLYYLSSRYKISVKKIKRANPGIKNWIYEDQIVKIPTSAELIVITTAVLESVSVDKISSTTNTDRSSQIPINHKVIKDQTLYSIAKQYGSSTDDIIHWNNLSDADIKSGQELIVGWLGDIDENKGTYISANSNDESATIEYSNDDVSINVSEEDEVPTINMEDRLNDLIKRLETEKKRKSTEQNKDGIEDLLVKILEMDEQGLAVTAANVALINDRYYVLHKNASFGTIIRLTSIDEEKELFVKVVGNIPNEDEFLNIDVIVSKLTAKYFEQNENERFEIRLNYGIGK